MQMLGESARYFMQVSKGVVIVIAPPPGTGLVQGKLVPVSIVQKLDRQG